MTVSAPHLMAHRIFSTSSSILEATAEFPILALILTRKLRPIIIGSSSGWLMLHGIMACPRATSSRTNSGVIWSGMLAPPRLARVLMLQTSLVGSPVCLSHLGSSHVFADGNEFHFGCNDTLAGLPQLGHWVPLEARSGFRLRPGNGLSAASALDSAADSACLVER